MTKVATRKVKKFYVEGSFGQIHCRGVFPENPNQAGVICCHKSPNSSQSYQDLLPHLAQDRFAVALDYPGYGESDPPPAKPPVQVEDYANAVWEVVDALTPAEVHLAGYHTGSMVAVEAAYQRPKQTISVINISAPVLTDEEQERLHQEYKPIPLDEVGTRFKMMWQQVLDHRGPGMTLEMAAMSYAANLRGGENYHFGHRAALDYANTYCERLKQIEQPLLVINPKDEYFEQSKRADKLMKNGQRLDCLQWGHGFLHAYAQDAAQVITNFFREIEKST